jgi:hypothetical protein
MNAYDTQTKHVGVLGPESKNFLVMRERLAKSGLKVTNTTCKGKAIGFVGGVRRPKPESADEFRDTSSEPAVN